MANRAFAERAPALAVSAVGGILAASPRAAICGYLALAAWLDPAPPG